MSKRPAHVVGPLGEKLTLADLPCSSNARWTPRRKAEVVAAVNGGLITFDEACERYQLDVSELAGWQGAHDRSGIRGLRVTRFQQYRDLCERRYGN
ncbi:MAG TPA: DUF1153 domain-containing protein [Sphingomicrobium sp.]|jgi:hypothetical protein|nr:DUF1153 domain-containing protein [Sphingomicrobium sp.]